ncbi:MAG: hypothetical protein HKM24_00940 [Gammaproteobacteria bacterium]|nr:hypothetical protein [Gammaproteobacteria bacterium]
MSRPTIVTMDNEEAEINVGEEVPFVTGQFTSTGSSSSSVNPFQTIQREDVGTKLTITPQINEGDAVIMDIDLEVSSVSESAQAVDLITNRRTIRQKVVVEDGGIIVLGGLIRDESRESKSRVPILGDIPLLGNLFKSQKSSIDKRNLMVFIRPTILRDGTESRLVTNSKYNYLRKQQQDQGEKINLMLGKERPMLPPIDELFSDEIPVDDSLRHWW